MNEKGGVMRTVIALASAAILIAGCAHRPINPDAVRLSSGIIIDGKGKDRGQVLQDGEECAAIAQETNPAGRAAAGAVAGAVVGALLGAVIFRASGVSGNAGAGYGAAAGAIGGAGDGAAGGAHDYRTVLRNCMIGRGHRPLN
jgi:outer membrane lipoprotein SlyB